MFQGLSLENYLWKLKTNGVQRMFLSELAVINFHVKFRECRKAG